MSYKKLVIKSSAAIEIEEVFSYYTAINKTLATKLEKTNQEFFSKNCKKSRKFSVSL